MSNYFDESCIYRAVQTYESLDQRDRDIVDGHRKGFSLAGLVSMSYRRPGEVMRLLGLPPSHFTQAEIDEASAAWKVIEECRIENQLARTPRRY
jgi:hypothetical protein